MLRVTCGEMGARGIGQELEGRGREIEIPLKKLLQINASVSKQTFLRFTQEMSSPEAGPHPPA